MTKPQSPNLRTLTIALIVALLCPLLSAKADKRPNILFAIADDASWKHFGAYGCEWVKTPAFDRIADQGLLFLNAYTPNAKCAPSRASILTGRNSWQLEEAANHFPFFPAKFVTYAEALDEHGYHVGGTGKTWSPGNPGIKDGKRRELVVRKYGAATTDPPAQHISKNNYAENFRLFLRDRAEGQPFCFWYGSTEPHRKYEWRAGIEKGGKALTDLDKVPEFWPDNETVRTDMLDYGFEIEYFDDHLHRMVDILEEMGELDNTLIVVTSDNGMPFPRVKGQKYEYSNHMPFAVMWPNGIKKPGRVIDDYVSFIDIAPTFLDVARIPEKKSGMQPIEGKSLTKIFASRKSGQVDKDRDFVLIGKERHDIGRPNDWGYPVRGIVKDGFLYLNNFETDRWPAGHPHTGYMNIDSSPTKTVTLDARYKSDQFMYWQFSMGKRPEEELYNVRDDEACIHNLAESPGHAELKLSLKEELLAKLKEQEDPRMLGNGEVFDEYPFSRVDMQNFYERYMDGNRENLGWHNPDDVQEE